MKILHVCVLIFYLHFIATAPSPDSAQPCIVILEHQDKWVKAYEKCGTKEFKELDQKFSNIPLTTKLEDFDFDDKCSLQCLSKELGMLTPDGMLDKKVSINLWKSNMTAPSFAKLENSWNSCIDEAETIGKKRKESNPCKIIALQTYCFKQKMEEIRVAGGGGFVC